MSRKGVIGPFGAIVSERLYGLKTTRVKAARAVDVSYPTFNNWMLGKAMPSVKDIKALSRFLKVCSYQLFTALMRDDREDGLHGNLEKRDNLIPFFLPFLHLHCGIHLHDKLQLLKDDKKVFLMIALLHDGDIEYLNYDDLEAIVQIPSDSKRDLKKIKQILKQRHEK
ncbi:MAG: XRE family transcriptional regulator [Candidatus Taylorbacteria bacterium]|nr:XRE family transcriptional regulator [Candidatus Taylorbacteria bacterium]